MTAEKVKEGQKLDDPRPSELSPYSAEMKQKEAFSFGIVPIKKHNVRLNGFQRPFSFL